MAVCCARACEEPAKSKSRSLSADGQASPPSAKSAAGFGMTNMVEADHVNGHKSLTSLPCQMKMRAAIDVRED